MKEKLVRILLVTALALCAAGYAAADSNYSLRAPDKRIEVRIHAADRIRYDVLLNGKPLLQDSTLSMKVEQNNFGVS